MVKTQRKYVLKEGKVESYCLIGTEFQFYKKKRVMRMDGGDGYTHNNVHVFNITALINEIKI